MTKPIIYAVVGASGCGKTTATKIMEDYGIPSLVSYTTRQIRAEKNALPDDIQAANFSRQG